MRNAGCALIVAVGLVALAGCTTSPRNTGDRPLMPGTYAVFPVITADEVASREPEHRQLRLSQEGDHFGLPAVDVVLGEEKHAVEFDLEVGLEQEPQQVRFAFLSLAGFDVDGVTLLCPSGGQWHGDFAERLPVERQDLSLDTG